MNTETIWFVDSKGFAMDNNLFEHIVRLEHFAGYCVACLADAEELSIANIALYRSSTGENICACCVPLDTLNDVDFVDFTSQNNLWPEYAP